VRWQVADEAAMRQLGGSLASRFAAGDVVFLHGDLGAGKTTFVRGLLAGLGWAGEVRSPTFNLLQAYEVIPPVLHADLYRVGSWQGIGIEDYLSTHLCLIEWPSRMAGLVSDSEAWHLRIEFAGEGREVFLEQPVNVRS